MVAIKLVTGSLELAVGIALFALSAAGLETQVATLMRQAWLQDPNAPLALFIRHRLPSLASHKALIAGALVSLGMMKVVGAVGLLKHRAWGFYLLLVLVAVLLPVDVLHAARQPSAVGALLLTLNMGVLAVLIAYRRQLVAREGWTTPTRSRAIRRSAG